MGAHVRKVTVNVPTDALERAQRVTGSGVTETIVRGLRELERAAQRSALRELKGKIHIDLDLEKTRR